MCERKIKGKWWLTDAPEDKVPGVLSYVPFERISLDLNGLMPRPDDSPGMLDTEILLGEAVDGTPITLLNTYEKNRRLGGSGGSSSWTVNQILVGEHYDHPSNIRFQKVSVRFTGLEHWLAQNPIRFDGDFLEKGHLTYSQPDSVEMSVSPLGATLSTRSNRKSRHGKFSYVLAHKNYLEVRFEESCSFTEVSRIVFSLQKLFMLLQGDTVQLAKCQFDDIDFICVQQGREPVGERLTHEMMLPYGKIEELFPSLVSSWFENREKFQEVRTLFFSHYYNPKMYPEVHFLTFIQALECYHRRRYEETYVDEREYQQWRETMTKSIPDEAPNDLRQSLKSRIQYGNELSLRKRLKTMMDNLGHEARELIAGGYDDLVHYVVKLRHYHTHYTRELEEDVRAIRGGDMPSGTDYIYLYWRLKAWLALNLLTDAGIPEGMVVESMKNLREWQYYLDQVAL